MHSHSSRIHLKFYNYMICATVIPFYSHSSTTEYSQKLH